MENLIKILIKNLNKILRFLLRFLIRILQDLARSCKILITNLIMSNLTRPLSSSFFTVLHFFAIGPMMPVAISTS